MKCLAATNLATLQHYFDETNCMIVLFF